jgi:hypothetical protein
MIMTILLAFRPFIFMGGCLFLLYAGLTWIAYPVMALISVGLALFLFSMVLSDQVYLHIARFGVSLKMLGKP